jgi:hypothetical protein
MAYMNLSPGLDDSWAMVGVRNGAEATLYHGYVENFSYHIPRTPIHALNDPAPVYLHSGAPEIQARMRASQAVVASTFAECMKLLANTWQPDIPHGSAADWRPIPR